MQDHFTGQLTRIQGRLLPGEQDRRDLQYDHERRLAALHRLGAAAAECGVRADSDRDLVLLAEDEVSLLEGAGGAWAVFGAAIRELRALLPLRPLEDFGFPAAPLVPVEGEAEGAGAVEIEASNPLEESNARLRRIGGGVEAWAFAAEADHSVYKFYLPREESRIGSEFVFRAGEETTLRAEAGLGSYRGLLEKLLLVHALGGMATEVVAVTPEGILVAKQALGEPLAQGDDMSLTLPAGLIEIPSRFLRANRDHPRLFFLKASGGGEPRAFLVADMHARNFVRCVDGGLRVIDLVAAPWPAAITARETLIADWLGRVRSDPDATALPGASDDEL
ncbi:MAG: hypothetical protein H7343_07140 [Undibacterium sp.]|nr:hypothetical protein [Opitutaceae bacterium]